MVAELDDVYRTGFFSVCWETVGVRIDQRSERSAYLGGFVAFAEMDYCLQFLAGSILREKSIFQNLPWAKNAESKEVGSNSMSDLVEGIVLGIYRHRISRILVWACLRSF